LAKSADRMDGAILMERSNGMFEPRYVAQGIPRSAGIVTGQICRQSPISCQIQSIVQSTP
jgi:hypothetical protein